MKHPSTPTLILNTKQTRVNIQSLADKAKANHIIFRPHFKTHQSHEIGRWYRELGVDKITVSSLKMAEYFATDNWNDITVAFPTNILEMDRINRLASKIQLNLLAESEETIRALESGLKYPVKVILKIDVGTHRTGINPGNKRLLDLLLSRLASSKKMQFAGFLAHAGHSYLARGKEEILDVHKSSTEILRKLKEQYKNQYPHLILSTGDTPTCSIAEDFSMVDEIRPGNAVFYDLSQLQIGSCIPEQISVVMACPVVAMHKGRMKIIIYGGGIHFSKDRMTLENGQTCFGIVAKKTAEGWKFDGQENYIPSLSQEHGVVSATRELMEKTKVGDLLYIYPVHSCMAADLMKSYLTTDGNTIYAMGNPEHPAF